MAGPGPSSAGLRSKLSTEIVAIDDELQRISDEIKSLRKRQRDLIEKKEQIQRLIDGCGSTAQNPEDQWDSDNFSWSSEAKNILQKNFRLTEFRPLQRAAINAVMSGEDVIVIMSTGGGKSLCYQLPAVLSKGLTVVVSPLISLVEDQLGQLKKLNINAATLNQNSSKEEVKRIETAITSRNSDFRLLYVTPEKLAKSKRIMNKLEKSLEVGFLKLIAIDEVHCCSQWGHDFRTDYKFLNVLKRQFKNVPLLGLTATATHNVLEDVKDMLGIPAAVVFRAGFNRPNLYYEVKTKSSNDAVAEIAGTIRKRFPNQSGIVYCFSRKDCEDVSKKLRENGVKALYYHAYLEADKRSSVHERWLSGSCQVIVATIAFGMGIDKPDVRFVIHHALPKSVENYYQESGRAGRDGNPSTCILYFRMADVFRQSTMVCSEKTGLANLYSMVRFATDNICRRTRLAEHFEEPWEPGWCQNSCDICRGNLGSKEENVTSIMKTAEEVINEQMESAKDGSGKITGGKLADLLNKKLRFDKEDIELIICHLLLEGYLKEDFHFTPYSIISYIQVGSRWKTSVSSDIVMMRKCRPERKKSPVLAQKTPNKKRKIEISDGEDDDDFVVLD